MGRYVRGSQGFSYKYAYGRQPSNLGELASWAGVGSGGFGGGLACQFLAPAGLSEGDLVDGAGPLTCVYQRRWPASDVLGTLGAEAPADVEFLIYAIADRWQDVLREVERRLPVPPNTLSLDAGASYALDRAQWGALAARIGHGVDPALPASFAPAQEALWASGQDELLPFLALSALQHAVRHDLERLELEDVDPVDTNLWDVVADVAGAPGPSWEERAMHARLLHYRYERAESAVLWRELLSERPQDLLPAHFLFLQAVWDSDWAGLETLVEPLLRVDRPDAELAQLLTWRGEARWARSGPGAAQPDALAAEALGDDTLQVALTRAAQPAQ
jgi:hypothetical protein